MWGGGIPGTTLDPLSVTDLNKRRVKHDSVADAEYNSPTTYKPSPAEYRSTPT